MSYFTDKNAHPSSRSTLCPQGWHGPHRALNGCSQLSCPFPRTFLLIQPDPEKGVEGGWTQREKPRGTGYTMKPVPSLTARGGRGQALRSATQCPTLTSGPKPSGHPGRRGSSFGRETVTDGGATPCSACHQCLTPTPRAGGCLN